MNVGGIAEDSRDLSAPSLRENSARMSFPRQLLAQKSQETYTACSTLTCQCRPCGKTLRECLSRGGCGLRGSLQQAQTKPPLSHLQMMIGLAVGRLRSDTLSG